MRKIFILFFLLFPFSAFGADLNILDENFDDFTVGTINGQQGWTTNGGTGDVSEITGGAYQTSPYSLRQKGFGPTQFRYTFTSTTTEEKFLSFYFMTDTAGVENGYNDVAGRFRIVDINGADFYLNFCHLSDNERSVKITDNAIGNDKCIDGSESIYRNTWNLVEIYFTNSIAKVRVNGGIWQQVTSINMVDRISFIEWDNTWSNDETFNFDSFGSGAFDGGISTNSYVMMFSPCSMDSRLEKYTECSREIWEQTENVNLQIFIDTIDAPAKVEIFNELLNTSTGNFELLENGSGLFLYTEGGTKFINEEYFLGFSTVSSSTYRTKVCILKPDDFAFFNDKNCISAVWGNGFTEDGFQEYLIEHGVGGIADDPDPSPWVQYGCDDINILDVKKGVICAGIYLFAPDEKAIQKFSAFKTSMLTLYPIGYATFIYNDISNTMSTTTNAFDRDIEVKRLFGKSGGTTTISVAHLTSKLSFIEKLVTFVNTLLWTAFAVWLLFFGLTRKL